MRADKGQLAPQKGQIDRQIIILRLVIKAPYALQYGFLGQELMRIAQKQLHQLIFLGRQAHAFAVIRTGKHSVLGIEPHIAQGELPHRRLILATGDGV